MAAGVTKILLLSLVLHTASCRLLTDTVEDSSLVTAGKAAPHVYMGNVVERLQIGWRCLLLDNIKKWFVATYCSGS